MNTAHRLADNIRAFVGAWIPNTEVSHFLQKGTLTPSEFAKAGDQLTFKFPTWHWQSSEPKYQVSWLPADKQYIKTCNVPCRMRVKDLDVNLAATTQTGGGEDQDWCIPGTVTATVDCSPKTLQSADGTQAVPLEEAENDSSFCHDGVAAPVDEDESDNEIVSARSYDITITYDKYYQTPRIWLFGYNEVGIPLNADQITEDIMSDYVSKTVTIDPHPCTGIPTVSIHPCRHAALMHKVVTGWQAQQKEVRSDLALFVLLKFIASAVPTIEYDFTMDIDMSVIGGSP